MAAARFCVAFIGAESPPARRVVISVVCSRLRGVSLLTQLWTFRFVTGLATFLGHIRSLVVGRASSPSPLTAPTDPRLKIR